jgi:hypothetical protein
MIAAMTVANCVIEASNTPRRCCSSCKPAPRERQADEYDCPTAGVPDSGCIRMDKPDRYDTRDGDNVEGKILVIANVTFRRYTNAVVANLAPGTYCYTNLGIILTTEVPAVGVTFNFPVGSHTGGCFCTNGRDAAGNLILPQDIPNQPWAVPRDCRKGNEPVPLPTETPVGP